MRVLMAVGAFIWVALAGCTAVNHQGVPMAARDATDQIAAVAGGSSDRVFVRTASATIEVWEIDQARDKLLGKVKELGGSIEASSAEDESALSLTARVPSNSLTVFMSWLEEVGSVRSRSVNSTDVTESYTDGAARIENKQLLRDQLRKLLLTTHSVTDIIAVQKELNAVQTDLDLLEGHQRLLKGQIERSTVEIRMERETVLGPVGVVLKGVGWMIAKLFYLRS